MPVADAKRGKIQSVLMIGSESDVCAIETKPMAKLFLIRLKELLFLLHFCRARRPHFCTRKGKTN